MHGALPVVADPSAAYSMVMVCGRSSPRRVLTELKNGQPGEYQLRVVTAREGWMLGGDTTSPQSPLMSSLAAAGRGEGAVGHGRVIADTRSTGESGFGSSAVGDAVAR